MRLLSYSFIVLLFGLSGSVALAQDIPPTTTLVYPGTDGKLAYVADSLGNKIPDFSNAGYKGGGVPIPYVAIKETVWPVQGDNSANIQAAIDRVSALPPDASGFRGAVLLKMGIYELEKPLSIKASGVVLRGEGMSDIGTILIGKVPKERLGGMSRGALVIINGASGLTPQEETKQIITDKYVPVGARSFKVVSAKAFKAGDKVIVRRIGNKDWIKEIGEDSATIGRYRWRPFNITYDRVITDVKGNTVTIDAPIFCAIETRWGGGELLKCDDQGRLEQVGVENLRGISEYNPTVRMTSYGNMDRGNFDDPVRPHYEGEEYYSDENHYFNFINFTNVKNSWVRNISALHFGSSVVNAGNGTKWITIQDCESQRTSLYKGRSKTIYIYD